MEYEKSFLKIITKMVKDFYKNRESYNVIKSAKENNQKAPKIYPIEQKYDKKPKDELVNLVTDFINENYFNSIETAEKIFLLINKCFNQAIKIYCKEHDDPERLRRRQENKQRKKLTGKIKFYAKGGLVLYMLKNKYLDTIENVDIKKTLNNNYDKFFKKSDMDFSIAIDNTSLSQEKYNQIYKDMSELSYYLLYLIRSHIRYFPTEYSDYQKLNNQYKKKLLEELRKKMNNSNYIKDQIDDSLYVCKLVHNNNYVEEPCNRDITYNIEKQFDTIIVKENNTSLKLYFPSKINNYLNEEVKDYYITYNNSIDFDINGDRTRFFLARLKSLFSIYIINSTNCCTFENLGGEMIDVSITHYESKQKLDIKDDLTLHKIKNYDSEFNIPTIEYFLKELELIIFNHKYPWAEVKWEKRLYRYLFLYIVVLIKSAKQWDLIFFYKIMHDLKEELEKKKSKSILKINNLPISPENTIFERLINNINILIKYINDDIKNINGEDDESNLILNLNNFISYVLIIFENIKIYQKIFNELYTPLPKPSILLSRQPSNILSINTSKQKYLKYKNKYISLKNKLKQKGGFNTCNESNSKYILPKIKNVFLNLIDYDLNLTTNDKFIQAYKILLDIYKNNNKTTPNFMTYDGEIIYKTGPFTDYTLNITALAFLSLLIEYQLFVIFYVDSPTVKKFNINDNKKLNNYSPVFSEPRIYRDDISKDNIITMLDKFCIEIDRLFARFMVNLIGKISKFVKNLYEEMEIQELYEKVKKHIIPPIKVKNISRTNNKYEYLYKNWKDRLNEEFKTLNKYEIDKIIKNTIELTLSQSSTDNQYTPDATGFFSWMYMFPQNDVNISKKFGSCITSTYLEHYLLHRIFESPKNISIGIQNVQGYTHPVWIKTIGETNIKVSHWTTIWWAHTQKLERRHAYTFRNQIGISVDNYYPENLTRGGNVNISNNKKLFLQTLIYPIFDNYLKYLEINKLITKNYENKKAQIEKSFTDFKHNVDNTKYYNPD